MTSATEEKNGINLTRMSFEMLESIENMQMQIIALHKENQEQNKVLEKKTREQDLMKLVKEQQKMIEQLNKKVKELEQLMARLKK